MMMLTLVTPVYAEAIEGQTTIRLKIRPQQGEWKYIEKAYSGRDNSTYYAVELYAETDEETFKLSGAQFYLNFDKDVLEFRTLKSTDDDSIKYDEDDNENALKVTQPTPNECNSKGYVPLILSCDANHVLKRGITLVTAVFTVKQNAESGIANFTLAAPKNEEKETMCSFNVTENGRPVVTSHTVDDSATATVTINGVAPTLDKVTVTDKNNNIVLDTSDSNKKFGGLEVNGTTDYTYQAHAWSTSGKEITGNVTWKLKSGSDLYDELNGATISEAGLLTIPRDAGAELGGNFFSFWVVATPKDGVSGNAIETNNIQINHEKQKIKTIQISRKNNETGALIIPGTGEAAATAEFVATCTNQYGTPYTGDQTIYWGYGRKDTNKSVTGIKMNGAVLSVSSDAKNVENGSVVLVVTATAGSGAEKVTSNEVVITVQRDTVQRPARIEVSGTVSTLAVPKTGEDNATATYTATVYDQYGTEMTDPGTIEWKLTNESESDAFSQKGVTIEQNGVLTVTKVAAENDFVESEDSAKAGTLLRTIWVKATCGGASGGTLLTLTRESATVESIVIEGIHSAALCKVPTVDDEENFEHELTVKKIDQYGVTTDAKAGEVTWDELNVTGVTLQHSTLTISPAAAGGHEFTKDQYGNLVYSFDIKATCGGEDATKTVTLTRQPSVATTLKVNPADVEVPADADNKAIANVDVTVGDQYGLAMTAAVELDGAQEGFEWNDTEKVLYVTKAAVKYFDGRRQESKTVDVKLKSGNVTATAQVTLKLADAQTSRDSAEITGQANIARPTGDTPNTAGYTIGDIVDQYGLPMEIDRSKLSLKLYSDKECTIDVNSPGDPVRLSGPVDGKWTITVTKDATVDTKYYLMAYYNNGSYDQQCSDAITITITNKQPGASLTVVQNDITYGTAVNPSVSNQPTDAGEITYTYAGRDGTTYTSTTTAPTNAGKYTVTATCEDATHIYTGSKDFEIKPKEIKVHWITLTNNSKYTYNGQEQTVQYTVKDGDMLVKDTDYTVVGDKGTNAGVYELKIIGKGNYTSDFTAAAGAPSVNWSIWAMPVKIGTATFQSRAYEKENYSAALTALTLVANEDGVAMPDTLTAGNGFTVSDIRVANNNAGQQPVSFKVTLTNTNYKWAAPETGNTFNVAETVGFTVEITKANHTAETVSTGGKYGNQLSVDLSQYLEGGSATVDTIADDKNILAAVEGGVKAIVQNGKLWLQLTDNSAKVGQSATVTLTVSSTNYNPFTITVTVTVQAKAQQVITASGLNVTYGDAGVKLNASALDNAQLTYEVTEGDNVIAVDENGNVTLKKSGTAKIEITAAETEDYGTATITVNVTVAKRSLTVKANDLTAYVGGQLPALDYTVTGLVSGETLTTVPELELKDVPAGVEPMKTAGTYTIGFKTAPTADAEKYDLTVLNGTLTVSSRPNVNPVPAGNAVKLEEAEGGKLTSSVSRATKGTTVTITVKPDEGYRLEELEVLDKNGESLPLKELANGKFSFEMPNSRVTVQATFAQESTYAGYPDVLPQDWFYSAVRYVTERGLMNGTPNGFEPNMDSSRATIWTILARFSGVDTTVVSGEWYAVARQWAMENGVSDGTNPNGIITREQLATMLYRYAQTKGLVKAEAAADLSVFVDADQISAYALDAMRWAVSVGLLNGMDGNRLAPQGSAARAQVATMLMRFDQLAK